jgi:hypothetical protein
MPAPSPAPGVAADKSSASTPSPAGGAPTQLSLAEQQGKADTALLNWILANSGQLQGDMLAGSFRVAYTITPAEGWWDKAGGGTLAWHDAPDNNVHLRIFVLDGVDGRFIPELKLRATLTDANGNERSASVDYGWYPLLNAYGGNVPLDTDSSYTLRVSVGTGHCEHGVEQETIAEFPPILINRDAVAQLPLATATAFPSEPELLKPYNAALSAAISALWRQSASGAEKAVGDYFVGYALDYSGLTMPLAGTKLQPKNMVSFSGKHDVRLWLTVRDSRTGRLIPGLKPQASLVSADGKLYGPGDLLLNNRSWLYHYEGNTRIAGKAQYKLRVHFDAPGYRRWGRQSERFAAPAEVEFDDVSLHSGKKD